MTSTPDKLPVRRSTRLRNAQKRPRSSDAADVDVADATEEKSDARAANRKLPRAGRNSSASSLKSSKASQAEPEINKGKPSATVMRTFLKSYKGLEDYHIPMFVAVKEYLQAHNVPNPSVIYPGCHKHVQASLVFPKVSYIDCDQRLVKHFCDSGIEAWINANKQYDEDSEWPFGCLNFESLPQKFFDHFDLMISACAGFVVKPCGHTLKTDTGHLLVSDAHFDARAAYVDTRFELIGVWDDQEQKLKDDKEDLVGHFTTTKGVKITAAHVHESATKPKRARSFRLAKECMFYLFRRIK